MAFSVKTTTRRRRSTAHGFTEINVTPLVDVMLVLLVIFMITAPMFTVGVPVDLPKAKAAKLNDQTEPLIITLDGQGRLFLNNDEIGQEGLVARLVTQTGQNKDAKIYVRGDQTLAYGRIMGIMGDIAAAGFSKVALIAEMPGGQGKKKDAVAPSVPAPAPAPVQSAKRG